MVQVTYGVIGVQFAVITVKELESDSECEEELNKGDTAVGFKVAIMLNDCTYWHTLFDYKHTLALILLLQSTGTWHGTTPMLCQAQRYVV